MPRPPALDPLFRSLRSIKGVGPQLGALLNRFFGGEGDAIALDLLMHMPTGLVDRRRMVGIAMAPPGHTSTLRLHIDRHIAPPRGRASQPHRVFAHDQTGEILLVYFRAQGNWIEKLLPVGEERFAVPITVADLAALPPSAALAELTLRELLALLGARVGRERLATIRAERGRGGMHPVLDAIFGEGFGPNDVFRAWQGAAEDLADTSLSVAGFRARLDGAIGLRALWSRMRDAVTQTAESPDEALSRDEAWFYGAELGRTLSAIILPDAREQREKQQLLRAFLASLAVDLTCLRPAADSRTWVGRIQTFYALSIEKEVRP